MITKTIPYGHQYVTEEDIKAVMSVLTSDYMTQGPVVGEFEKDFCNYLGCKYARMVSNGTAALHICAQALGIKPGDKVITTPITFVASANGFRYEGAEIVFCDIDPKTFLMDLDKLEDILKASPKGTYKAVVPVDFAGYPIDEERLRALADEYGFYLVVDACHAPGAKFSDSKGEMQLVGNGKFADFQEHQASIRLAYLYHLRRQPGTHLVLRHPRRSLVSESEDGQGEVVPSGGTRTRARRTDWQVHREQWNGVDLHEPWWLRLLQS